MRAIDIEYPSIGAGPLLAVLGIARIDPVDDKTSATLVALRDMQQLPPRVAPAVRAAPGALDWHLTQSKVPQAWALLGGPDAINWRGIKVGHLDTGYSEHPAFGFPGASWIDQANARTFMPDPPIGEAMLPSAEPGGGRDNLIGGSAGHGTRIGATNLPPSARCCGRRLLRCRAQGAAGASTHHRQHLDQHPAACVSRRRAPPARHRGGIVVSNALEVDL